MDFVEESENKPKKVHTLWVEKYRPALLDGYLGNETLKTAVSQMIEKRDIPHLLFHGPAGTGKTTLAKLLVANIPCDYLYVNASAENGIDTVREKLKNFAMGAGFKPLKVIILDEADFLSTNAQAGLRNFMEAYSLHTRFIITCNYPEKVIPALVSRCQTYEVKPISKKEVAQKLVSILQAEKVQFTVEDLGFIVNTYYPDIRKVIQFAQQSNVNGVIKICKENALEADVYVKIVEILKNPSKPGAFQELRQIVADIDPTSLEQIYKYLFDKVDTYAKGKEALVILELGEAVNYSALVIPKVRDITFMASMQKIMKHLGK
jgi:DNA polymerase III delta prime subunit